MTPSVGRLAAGATGGLMVLMVLTLGGLSWTSFHSAEEAAADDATRAGEYLRLLGALLLVVLVFLIGTLTLVAVHVATILRAPLFELTLALQRIRGGALRERVLPQGPVEMQDVTRGVNAVTDSLAQRDARMKRTVTIGTIGSLIHGFAHEVHTPLTVMRLNDHLLEKEIRALQDRHKGTPEAGDHIAKALRLLERNRASMQRLESLSRALREVVRTGHGAHERDVNLLLAAAVAITHHRMAGGAHMALDLHATRHLECDASELFHALHALLIQASSALQDGDNIRVSTYDTEDGVSIVIAATATEVLPEILDLMSESGQEADDSPASDLRFAQRVIEANAGTLRFEGHDGGGMSWHVVLPAKTELEGSLSATRPSPSAAEPQDGETRRTPVRTAQTP